MSEEDTSGSRKEEVPHPFERPKITRSRPTEEWEDGPTLGESVLNWLNSPLRCYVSLIGLVVVLILSLIISYLVAQKHSVQDPRMSGVYDRIEKLEERPVVADYSDRINVLSLLEKDSNGHPVYDGKTYKERFAVLARSVGPSDKEVFEAFKAGGGEKFVKDEVAKVKNGSSGIGEDAAITIAKREAKAVTDGLPKPKDYDPEIKSLQEAIDANGEKHTSLEEEVKRLAEASVRPATPTSLGVVNSSDPSPTSWNETAPSKEQFDESKVIWVTRGNYNIPTRLHNGSKKGIVSDMPPPIKKPTGWSEAKWQRINQTDWALVR